VYPPTDKDDLRSHILKHRHFLPLHVPALDVLARFFAAQNCRFFDGNDKYGLEGHDCESEAGTKKDQTIYLERQVSYFSRQLYP